MGSLAPVFSEVIGYLHEEVSEVIGASSLIDTKIKGLAEKLSLELFKSSTEKKIEVKGSLEALSSFAKHVPRTIENVKSQQEAQEVADKKVKDRTLEYESKVAKALTYVAKHKHAKVVRKVTSLEAQELGLLKERGLNQVLQKRDEKIAYLQCHLCSFKTRRPNHLERHQVHHDTCADLLMCDECDFTCIRSGDLARHKKKEHEEHGEGGAKCQECDYSSPSPAALKKHWKQKHDKTQKTFNLYECSKCDYKTLKVLFYARHLRKHTKNDHKVFNPDAIPKSTKNWVYCLKCMYRTSKGSNLERHKAIHTGVRRHLCNICGTGFKRSDTLKQHLAVHADEDDDKVKQLPKCQDCGKVCRSQTHLAEHATVHSGSRDFLCDLCGARFRTKPMQLRHMKMVHEKTQSTKCPICQHKFYSRHTLSRHLKVAHEGHILQEHVEEEQVVQHVEEVEMEEEDEEEEPVIYTLDLNESASSLPDDSLHAYLISESGTLIVSDKAGKTTSIPLETIQSNSGQQ